MARHNIQRDRVVASLVLGAALVGCGGGATGPGATDPSGNPVTTASGVQVSEEAHNRWTAGVELFTRYEAQGWNADRCGEVSGRFESAAEAQGGRFAEALYMAGVAISRCNNDDRARAFYDQALRANEKFCKARVAIGVMALDAGQDQEAFNTFQRALRDDPQCTEGYVNVAIIQRRRGGAQVREALNNLRRALAIESDYLPAFNEMALLYVDQSSGNEQMLDLAAVVCRQAQQINRDYAPIYNTWGLINVRKGNVIEALRMFERAKQLDNSMFEAFMNFGEITISFRGYEDARVAFARAVELRPRDYDAHIGLGAALRGLNQAAPAQEQYEAAVAIDGNRPEAYFNLGILYQDYKSGSIEDLNRAKRYYEQFLAKVGSRFGEQAENVRRRCQQQQQSGRRASRARRRNRDCRPGRLQNIETAVEALTAAAQMQQGQQ